MNNLTYSVTTFKDLVVWLHQKLADDLWQELKALLAGLESEIERDSSLKGWESIGKRQRALVSLFGMKVEFERRGYRWKKADGTVEYRYPLDELLGLPSEERFCPLVQHLAVGLAAKMSFREAAAILQEYFRVPVSHQEIHRWVQEAGKAREAELESEVEAVFERGEAPGSEGRSAPVVVIEADGIGVHLQREQSKKAELKLGIMHEGWEAESPAKKRFRLVNKGAWAGFLPGQAFWERGAVRFAKRYTCEKVDRIVINGDGAEWVKEARRHFEGAEVYLDRFHRNRALRQGLGFEPELLNRAMEAIQSRDLGRLKQVLAEALGKAPGEEHVKRVIELHRYLQANWEGLLDWRDDTGSLPGGARGLGAAEAEINHVLAARMTKRGMSWRTQGAHHMALLRCLDAEERLSKWLEGWQKRRWPEVQRVDGRHAPRRVIERLSKTDPRVYLAGHLPLLVSAAGKSELGRRLKQLARGVPPSDLVSRAQPAGWGKPILPIRKNSA